jgi:formylglycine-generating enzyme required for sulfatase activity
VVATSRIVGYDEAPLTGQRWRTYTLTDFTQADIERFVTQWTLAFARSIQGDTEPARQSAAQERRDLLQAIFHNPSVERLAANPLLLTILALIKHTGVTLPEERIKLYELYLQTLIESWNRARSLNHYPVGESMRYEETVQVLAPLALWLRQENPTAGLVNRAQLERWLTDYYRGDEWRLPRGEARQRGRAFLDSVQRYSNLLLERGERQYGFLHLTLEEMLAAQGIVQRMDASEEDVLGLFKRYLLDPAWQETLQLAIGFIGVIQWRPRVAGEMLQQLLAREASANKTGRGRSAIFAGKALLDMGPTNLSRAAALKIEHGLVQTMQAAACPIRIRRDAGDLLGRLGWTPDPQEEDVLLAPAGYEPTGLDAFRFVPSGEVWMGKYPVTNRQFARFIASGGYHRREYWSDAGWAWRTGASDSKAPRELRIWLKLRPPDRRAPSFRWDDRKWNSPLFPVVGITWFEAEAYACWLSEQLRNASTGQATQELREGLVTGRLMVRLPVEVEWEAAIGDRGKYPWGARFDRARLNCAESWVERRFSNEAEWLDWIGSDAESSREASTTAVTTYPQGASKTGVCDGSGNVWEWMDNTYIPDDNGKVLRGGSWEGNYRGARVAFRRRRHPGTFNVDLAMRVVMAPVLK